MYYRTVRTYYSRPTDVIQNGQNLLQQAYRCTTERSELITAGLQMYYRTVRTYYSRPTDVIQNGQKSDAQHRNNILWNATVSSMISRVSQIWQSREGDQWNRVHISRNIPTLSHRPQQYPYSVYDNCYTFRPFPIRNTLHKTQVCIPRNIIC
jgi:hypothetical protein